MSLSRSQIIEKRRALSIEPFRTLADVGFDGDWVSPYQISSCSPTGPVLVALHWLDEPSINEYRQILSELGYLPGIRFNNVLDLALGERGLLREDIYVTQAFHLVPAERSQAIAKSALVRSFEAVTIHELVGRKVIGLGAEAGRLCEAFGVEHVSVCHPSRRGFSNEQNAAEISAAFSRLGF
ncbi:hypothetical protein [Parvibaculum sp.]|uniref:hypothetical protein n=1 Tax=Parvibaculum sp. TaxID=2024848 RepID=UPI000C931FE2|nr:hypothetical protein [Parvibaculum sp.]MAB13318.1 hypothetical protein [Parvibaculum sp.]